MMCALLSLEPTHWFSDSLGKNKERSEKKIDEKQGAPYKLQLARFQLNNTNWLKTTAEPHRNVQKQHLHIRARTSAKNNKWNCREKYTKNCTTTHTHAQRSPLLSTECVGTKFNYNRARLWVSKTLNEYTDTRVRAPLQFVFFSFLLLSSIAVIYISLYGWIYSTVLRRVRCVLSSEWWVFGSHRIWRCAVGSKWNRNGNTILTWIALASARIEGAFVRSLARLLLSATAHKAIVLTRHSALEIKL